MAFEQEMADLRSALKTLDENLREMMELEHRAEKALASGELAKADVITQMDGEATEIRGKIRQMLQQLQVTQP